MWQYNYSSGNSMSHGIEWKKHKYYTKVKLGPKKYRYFYTKAEYQAYLKKKQATQANPLSSFLSKNNNGSTNSKPQSSISSFLNKFKSTTTSSSLKTGKSFTSSFLSKFSAKPIKSVSFKTTTGKNAVSKILSSTPSSIAKPSSKPTKSTKQPSNKSAMKVTGSLSNKTLSSIKTLAEKGKKALEDASGVTAKKKYEETKQTYEKYEIRTRRYLRYMDEQTARIQEENDGHPDETYRDIEKKYKLALNNKIDAAMEMKEAKDKYDKSLVGFMDRMINAVSDFVEKGKKLVDDLTGETAKREREEYHKELLREQNRKKITDGNEAAQKEKERQKEKEYSGNGGTPASLSNVKKKAENWYDKIKYFGKSEKDIDQDLINPNYAKSKKKGDGEYTRNCAYCTIAYDFRRRGYDVEAAARDGENYRATLYDIAGWYTNTSIFDWKKKDAEGKPNKQKIANLISTEEYLLKNMPNESYGQFVVTWTPGGAHSMVWEKENGKIKIRDCQTHETYSMDQFIEVYGPYVDTTYVLRTDNREFSENALYTIVNKEERA